MVPVCVRVSQSVLIWFKIAFIIYLLESGVEYCRQFNVILMQKEMTIHEKPHNIYRLNLGLNST